VSEVVYQSANHHLFKQTAITSNEAYRTYTIYMRSRKAVAKLTSDLTRDRKQQYRCVFIFYGVVQKRKTLHCRWQLCQLLKDFQSFFNFRKLTERNGGKEIRGCGQGKKWEGWRGKEKGKGGKFRSHRSFQKADALLGVQADRSVPVAPHWQKMTLISSISLYFLLILFFCISHISYGTLIMGSRYFFWANDTAGHHVVLGILSLTLNVYSFILQCMTPKSETRTLVSRLG